MRLFGFVLLLTIISTGAHSGEKSVPGELFANCPTLTWPDGRESKLRSYQEMEKFSAACGDFPTTCRLDGKLFPQKKDDDSLAKAMIDCMLGPLQVSVTSEPKEKKVSVLPRENSVELCNICRQAYAYGSPPILSVANNRCSAEVGETRTTCVTKEVAYYYLRREQVGELAVLYDNIFSYCPSPQTREFFKERLYYLATQLHPEDIPSDFKNFDFGPVDLNVLGGIAAHRDPDNKGNMYARALAKHHPGKRPGYEEFFRRYCIAQPVAPAAP